jgi:hypothetical protein
VNVANLKPVLLRAVRFRLHMSQEFTITPWISHCAGVQDGAPWQKLHLCERTVLSACGHTTYTPHFPAPSVTKYHH